MLDNSLKYIKRKIGDLVPDVAVILGTGLGEVTNALDNPIKIKYTDIPDFPQTTVAGHKGLFYIGKLGKHTVLFMQGRFHLYEGHKQQLIADIVYLLADLGVKQLIVTNAAGSLTKDIPVGSIMLISDHINMSGRNPLIGPHRDPYFPDLSQPYNLELIKQFKSVAEQYKIKLYEGVYIFTLGPNFETPAEVRMFRMIGGDAVGMSTVPEVIVANQCKMKVLGISVISNLGTGLTDEIHSHEEVLKKIEETTQSLETLENLLKSYLEKY